MSDIPLNEVVYFDAITSDYTGANVNADSTPTFAVYEEDTDTDIGVGGNMTQRTALTGQYRGSFTMSAANGFEVGKFYSVIGSATVNGITGKADLLSFRCCSAEAVVGSIVADITSLSGSVGSVTGAVGSVTGNVGGNVVGSVASVTGAVGSVTGAVASVTGNVGGNVVGSVASVTGAVGSVTGAVGSVTGNVGGNVTGSVASVTGNVSGSVASVVGLTASNLDTTISSRLASATNATSIAAILSSTNNLPSDPADESLIIAATNALAAAIAALNNLSAAQVLTAMNAAPPSVNVQKVNTVTVQGTGTDIDPWRPA